MRSNRFHRKYSRPLAGILLVALALRALVPVGFMPMVDADGSLTLALCPGTQQSPPPAQDPHAHHGHHLGSTPDPGLTAGTAVHHHQGDDGSGPDNGPSAGHNVPCPFAASATQAPAPELAAVGLSLPQVAQARARESADVILPAILRAQSARAPPSLI